MLAKPTLNSSRCPPSPSPRKVISRARALIEDGKPQAPPPQNLVRCIAFFIRHSPFHCPLLWVAQPAKENSAAWMQLLLSTHPSIAALAYYEQGLLRRLLERVTYEWTRDNSFSPQMVRRLWMREYGFADRRRVVTLAPLQHQCMWTYALLAALEVGQPARLIAMLRVLLQRCLRVVDASVLHLNVHSPVPSPAYLFPFPRLPFLFFSPSLETLRCIRVPRSYARLLDAILDSAICYLGSELWEIASLPIAGRLPRHNVSHLFWL